MPLRYELSFKERSKKVFELEFFTNMEERQIAEMFTNAFEQINEGDARDLQFQVLLPLVFAVEEMKRNYPDFAEAINKGMEEADRVAPLKK